MAYEGLVVIAILLLASLPFAGAATGRLEGLGRHLFQAYLFLILGLYFVWCWRRGGQTLPMKTWLWTAASWPKKSSLQPKNAATPK